MNREIAGHCSASFWIGERNVGDGRFTYDRNFGAPLYVSNDGELRNVRTSARRAWDEHHRGTRPWHLIDPFEVADLSSAAHDHSDPLGAIHWAATTNGYDRVTAFLAIALCPGHYLVIPRIGRHTREQGERDLLRLKLIEQLDCPGLHQYAWIRHN